jgi:hypothetical protein
LIAAKETTKTTMSRPQFTLLCVACFFAGAAWQKQQEQPEDLDVSYTLIGPTMPAPRQ